MTGVLLRELRYSSRTLSPGLYVQSPEGQAILLSNIRQRVLAYRQTAVLSLA